MGEGVDENSHLWGLGFSAASLDSGAPLGFIKGLVLQALLQVPH